MSDQLALFPDDAPPRPDAGTVLAQAYARRHERPEDPEALDLQPVRCPVHQITHWRGIRCPRCLFGTTTAPAAVLAYGTAARRERTRQQLGGDAR